VITVAAAFDILGARIVRRSDSRLARAVRRVFVTDLADPGRYLADGDIVLTGLMWHRGAPDSQRFVEACARAGVSAVGAGVAAHGNVPVDLLETCRRHDIALFEIPLEVSFAEIADLLDLHMWSRRANGLAMLLGRQRRLVRAAAGGARLRDLLPAVAGELGVRCVVVTPAGRILGIAPADPAGDAELLMAAAQSAMRAASPATINGAHVGVTVVPGRTGHRLDSWFAVAASAEDAVGLDDALVELHSLVAVERARLDEVAALERRLADQLLSVTSGDLAVRLQTCGLDPGGTFLVAAATIRGRQTPHGLAAVCLNDVARTVHDAVAVASTPQPEPDTDTAYAVVTIDGSATSAAAVDAVRRAAARLEAGLDPAQRLAIGLSAPTATHRGLNGARQQALHAMRVSAARPGERVSVVSATELASHLVLLAGIPAEVGRTFHAQLIEPLIAYDRRHRTKLVETLDHFLGANGSYGRCADSLHVHVNTLRYRIARIERLTGRDLGTFVDRVDFHMAMWMARFRNEL